MSVKECCTKEANLVQNEEDQVWHKTMIRFRVWLAKLILKKTGHKILRPSIIVRRCKVCKCRHITMTAEPGVIGLRGSSM